MKLLRSAACVLVAVTVSQADAQAPAMQGMSMAPKSATATPWAAQNETSMARMDHAMASSTSPQPGNEDQAFVQGMIPHHQGAVDMAKTELSYGHDPEMRRLARSIVAAQERELGLMKAWQARHPDAS